MLGLGLWWLASGSLAFHDLHRWTRPKERPRAGPEQSPDLPGTDDCVWGERLYLL